MGWKALFEKTELSAGLTPAEVDALYELFEQRSVREGAVIFEEESRGRELFFVCEGRVEIVMRGLREDDKRMVVNDVRSGQCFGEMALVDGAPRSAQARAKDDCVLLMLREANFRVLAEKHPRIGYVVMRNLASTVASRLRTTNLRLRNNHDWVSILGSIDLPSGR